MPGVACAVCGADCEERKAGLFDDRYGYPGSFDLAECPACGHAMTVPGLSDDDLPGLYQTYYPRRSVDIPALADQVGAPGSLGARWRRWFNGTDNQGHYLARPGMKVLDYGCGSAVSLLEVRALGGEPYGIEADPNVARIAEHYGLSIHIGRIEDNPFPGMKFDLIVLNQVVEHLPDPARLLGLLSERLAEGGRLVCSFPNARSLYRRLSGKQWINWHVPYHQQHFCAQSFRVLAQRCGFSLESFRTVTPNLWTQLQWQARHVTAPGVINPVWGGAAPSPQQAVAASAPVRGGLFRRGWRFLRRVVRSPLWLAGAVLRRTRRVGLALTNRAIDRAGLGDSILVVLRPARSAA